MALRNPFKRKVSAPPSNGAEQIIGYYAKWAGGVGCAGCIAVHADTGVLVLVWTRMIYRLARHHGIGVGRADCLKLAAALTTSSLAFTTGWQVATTYFAWTGVGTPGAMLANASVNYALTYAAGQSVSDVFAKTDPSSGLKVASIIVAIRDLFLKNAGRIVKHP